MDAVTKFEDEEDGIDKVMFINPLQMASLLKDDDFISADKFQSGVAVSGAIGMIAGCWVKKSKKVTKNTSEIPAKYALQTSAPSDWSTAYASYFTKSGSTYSAVTGNSAPTWAANTYYTKTADAIAANTVWINPIIKCEPDSAETEYTEAELPAVTIFLKKETQVDPEYFPKKQTHDITASKYYGVAVTNASKVVIAKFAVTTTA